MPRYKRDYTGMRNGMLEAVQPDAGRKWWFRCDCGNEKSIRASSVLNDKNTKSCGCATNPRAKTHGLSKTFEYGCWISMKKRCLYKKHPKYADYGGAGITIDASWLGPAGFLQFYRDMGPAPDNKHSIDRRDGTLGYTKTNCHWATNTEQARNRRPQKRSRSGMNGVTWNRHRKHWTVYLSTKYIGSAHDVEVAKEMRRKAEAKYW